MVHDLTKKEAFEEWEEIFKWSVNTKIEMSYDDSWPCDLWEVDTTSKRGDKTYIAGSPTKFNTWQLAEFIEWAKNNVKD